MPTEGSNIFDMVRPITIYQIGEGVPWNEWEASMLGVGSIFRSYDVVSSAQRALDSYAGLYSRVEDREYTKSELIAHLYSVCERFNLDKTIAHNQIMQESSFNRTATGAFCVLGTLNKKCGLGIAQFIPGTGRAYGLRIDATVDDRLDPIKSLDAYGAHMSDLLASFGGDYLKALAAYNVGPGAVAKAVERNGEGWLSAMPAETQGYVAAIMGAGAISDPAAQPARAMGAKIGIWDILTSDLGPDLLKRWALFAAAMIILVIALLPAALRVYREVR
jgi:soluble lytic murein transglycosylase-like protein